jgi:long-chain acyl-CoA synthetase
LTNLTNMLVDTAAEHGDRTAIRLDDLAIPYAGLEASTHYVAGLLASKGVGAGDRIGVMLPNVPYFPSVFFGALRLGAVVVPMNPLLKEREVGFQLSDSGARLIVAWHQFGEAAQAGAADAGAEAILVEPGVTEQEVAAAQPIEEIAERADDDPALILYTSGTTGMPKGAELTHGNLYAATQVAVDLVEMGPDTVIFGGLPLFHVFGLTSGLNSAVRRGACLTLLPRFDPTKTLEIIQRDRVGVFLGVPTMYAALLHQPEHGDYDGSSLELCVSGGAAMPVEILRGFEDAFGCKVLEGYGLSETCAIASFNRPDRQRKPGSIGIPVPGTEMRVVDDEGQEAAEGEIGEIEVRGPTVMKG